MYKHLTRLAVAVAAVMASLVVTAPPAQAAVIDLHKSTADIGGVHIAVVLRKNTETGHIFAYCSLSGNSGVYKRLNACQVRRGNAVDNETIATGAASWSYGNVESGTAGKIPVCSYQYAAYIGYELVNVTGERTGRTQYVNPC